MTVELNPWASLKTALGGDPNKHYFGGPCPTERQRLLAENLGPLPGPLRQMLSVFDGAELSIDAIPLFTLLGTKEGARYPGFDVSIETYTKRWRESSTEKGTWVIGFTNYGGRFIVGADNTIREWGSAESKWLGGSMSGSHLVKRIVAKCA